MKIITSAAVLSILLSLSSCKKNVDDTASANSVTSIDSINAARTKYNDSIKKINDAHRFADLSGAHKLKYQNADAGITLNGSVDLTKKGRDEYDASGSAKYGENTVKIEGTIKRVSEKHLNFDGSIQQNIGGETYTRNKKLTFFDEGKGPYFRLQDKVNGQGFVEYLDIKK